MVATSWCIITFIREIAGCILMWAVANCHICMCVREGFKITTEEHYSDFATSLNAVLEIRCMSLCCAVLEINVCAIRTLPTRQKTCTVLYSKYYNKQYNNLNRVLLFAMAESTSKSPWGVELFHMPTARRGLLYL